MSDQTPDVSDSDRQSMENARRNAGIPVTSGDVGGTDTDSLAGTSGAAPGETTAEAAGPDADRDETYQTGEADDGLDDLTLEGLRTKAKEAGVAVSGNKDELVERLREAATGSGA